MKKLLRFAACGFALAGAVTFTGNAQSIEDLWSRILIPFDYDYTFYGYDLRESSLDPSEYWVDYNWEEGEEIDLWGGTSGGNSNYIIRPYVTRLDENHVLLHGLLKDFCGLFDTSDDYTLVGEVNAEDMTIAIVRIFLRYYTAKR